MTTRYLGIFLLVAAFAATQSQAQQPSAVRRASHQRSIHQLHEPIAQVSHHADCCGAAVGCGQCGACASCCVCRPCFPLLRGVARAIDRTLTAVFTCNRCCGRPVCGPSGCGCDLPWDSGGCGGGCDGGCDSCASGAPYGHPMEMGPPPGMPTPALGNPFQDDPTPVTPSSYRRPTVRTKACTSCGVSARAAASSRRVSANMDAAPRVVAPIGSSVKQASFSGDTPAPPASGPTANRPARTTKYRR